MRLDRPSSEGSSGERRLSDTTICLLELLSGAALHCITLSTRNADPRWQAHERPMRATITL